MGVVSSWRKSLGTCRTLSAKLGVALSDPSLEQVTIYTIHYSLVPRVAGWKSDIQPYAKAQTLRV